MSLTVTARLAYMVAYMYGKYMESAEYGLTALFATLQFEVRGSDVVVGGSRHALDRLG
jgi:hypothetical protein